MAKRKRSESKAQNPKQKTVNPKQATLVCPPCRYTWEGPALFVIGLLGLVHYFGLLNLSVINWSLLEPIIVLILGLLIMNGVLHK